jgi:hypothetical protein
MTKTKKKPFINIKLSQEAREIENRINSSNPFPESKKNNGVGMGFVEIDKCGNRKAIDIMTILSREFGDGKA